MQLLPWFFLVPKVGKLHSKEKPVKSSSANDTLQLIVEEKWQEIMSSDQVELLKI